MNRNAIMDMANAWVDRYVKSLEGRRRITIDVDGTDDPTHGRQQLSLFNGYYKQFMYNQLFFHDGDTGQIILIMLNPTNKYVISLYDYDEFDADDFMGGIEFIPYSNSNGFPKTYKLDAGGPVIFELSLKYTF